MGIAAITLHLHRIDYHWPPALLLGLAALAVMAGDLVQIPVSIGSRRWVITSVELSVVLGFLFLPALTLPLVVTLGSLACEVLHRRVWYKLLANVANHTTPICVAALIFTWLHPGPASASPSAWPALTVATLVFSLLNALCTSAVIAMATQSRVWPAVARALPAQAVSCGGNLLLALVGLILWVVPRAGVVVVPVAAVAAWWEYRRLLRTRTERDGLALLDRASRPIAALDPLAAFTEVADRAGDLLGADEVQVRVLAWPPHDAAWCFRRRRGTADAWEQTVADTDAEQPALAVPLVSGSAVLGSLELRIDHALSVQERHVLNAFAATVASAVDHARGFAAATHAASHDPLTGLSNRPGLAARISEALAGRPPIPVDSGGRRTPPEGDGISALLLLDLDHFKEVNDTLGHHAGDELLRIVGRRLAESLRTDDTVARLGGDEFGMVLPRGGDRDETVQLLTRVRDELAEEVTLDGITLSVEASFGVCFYPDDADTVEGLLQHADAAMYQGKHGPTGVVVYRPSAPRAASDALVLHRELRQALTRDELVLHYQPKIELGTGRVTSVEALVRWQHPQRGLLPPSEFLPVAERSELIEPLTRWVLRRALADYSAWTAAGHDWTVAVNVSARNLSSLEFAGSVLQMLAEAAVAPDRLHLEVTETALAFDSCLAGQVVDALSAHGIVISIDDFGIGFTGLSQLRTLDVAEIKIDRTFIAGLLDNQQDRAIVLSVIDLGHRLGCSITAEGVEVREVADWPRHAGCDHGQGYLWLRPAPWAEVARVPGAETTHTAARPVEPAAIERAVI